MRRNPSTVKRFLLPYGQAYVDVHVFYEPLKAPTPEETLALERIQGRLQQTAWKLAKVLEIRLRKSMEKSGTDIALQTR